MSIRYHVNFFKIGLLLVVLGTVLFARHALDQVNTYNGEKLNKYEYETEGDSYLMSCDWEDNKSKISENNAGAWSLLSSLVGIPIKDTDSLDEIIGKLVEKEMPVDGICKSLNYETVLSGETVGTNSNLAKIVNAIRLIMDAIYIAQSSVGTVDPKYTYIMEGITDFIGKDRVGSKFDLGAFAKCDIKQEKIEKMLLSKFCAGEDNVTFSPASVLTSYTVDAMGLPSYSGKNGETNETIKKVSDRDYLAKDITGKILYEDNGTNTNGDPDGGFLLAEAKKDPQGSTARAFYTFDKATIMLKTLAVQNFGKSDANATTLPATKAKSMDLEDQIVQLETRMDADLNQFGDTLTRVLRKELLDKTSVQAPNWNSNKPHLAGQALYKMREKNVTSTFFKSKTSGLTAIYKGIEDEAKARMASEMLLMTADPNYIADPSEARAALIKPSQRNKFRYAALIQQEKNKMLKLKYAKEIKRKQQMVDIIKQQAYIRASIFRDEIVVHELKHLLDAADKSIEN